MCVKIVVIYRECRANKKMRHCLGGHHDIGLSIVNEHFGAVNTKIFSLQRRAQDKERRKKVKKNESANW